MERDVPKMGRGGEGGEGLVLGRAEALYFSLVNVHEERVVGVVLFDEVVRIVTIEEAAVCTVASGRLLPSFTAPEVNATVGLEVADLRVMIFTAPEEAKEVVEATACREVGRLACSKMPLSHHRRRVRLFQFLWEECHSLINSPGAVQSGWILLVDVNWVAPREEGRPGGGTHFIGIVACQLSTACFNEVVDGGGDGFVIGDLRFVVAQVIHEEEDEVWLLRGKHKREKEGKKRRGDFICAQAKSSKCLSNVCPGDD